MKIIKSWLNELKWRYCDTFKWFPITNLQAVLKRGEERGETSRPCSRGERREEKPPCRAQEGRGERRNLQAVLKRGEENRQGWGNLCNWLRVIGSRLPQICVGQKSSYTRCQLGAASITVNSSRGKREGGVKYASKSELLGRFLDYMTQ